MLLVLAYCLIETVYVLRLPVVMDEFDGAYEAYRLRHELPYRDYLPYKTVLGYFIEAIPALLPVKVWPRIMAIKIALVLINTAMLAAAGRYLARFFDRTAVIAALVLLIVCSNFLERSAELRVDMLKGAVHFVAANAALIGCFVLYARTRSRFRDITLFNVAFTGGDRCVYRLMVRRGAAHDHRAVNVLRRSAPGARRRL